MAIEDELAEIRSRITRQQAQRVRAQVEHEQAVEQRDRALKTLRTEFGVHSTAEAKAEIERLEAALEAALEDAEQKLEAAGA